MANYYKTPLQIVQECVDDYQTITGIVVDPNDLTRDETVKFWWIGTALAHWYSALQAASNNQNPETADVNGLNSALEARGLPTQIAAQPSEGIITISGTEGTDFPAGSQVTRNLTGDVYVSQEDAVIPSGGSITVPFQSLASGQGYNIANTSEAFTVVSPPTGITAACTGATAFTDGRDIETTEEMLARVQAYDQNEQTGGNLAAYEEFARAASPDVVTATAVSCPSGPDTVGVVITSGTTDIAAAVDGGQSVVRVPSDDLVDAVQTYIEEQNPTTDIVTVSAPTEESFNVTFLYDLANEDLRTQTDPAIENIIAIYLYSAASGDILQPTDIERLVDERLGSLITARRCSNLGESTPEYTIPFGQIVKPGTITLDTL